jgi:hypothetical protein
MGIIPGVINNEFEHLPQVLKLVLDILNDEGPQHVLPLEVAIGNFSDHF